MRASDQAPELARPDRNVMLVVAYDGTRYHGFQAQAEAQQTIQGELEQAIARITGFTSRVAGAGRTDSGVHALGQVVTFRTPSALAAPDMRRAMNAVLPLDIAVRSAQDMPPSFHARFSARSRQYRYTVLNDPVRSPLERYFVLHVPRPLDVTLMALASGELVGEHDFASFAGAVEAVESTVRRVLSCECYRQDSKVLVDIVADAFLPHMVRNVVGTLLLVGTGKLGVSGFREILQAKQRAKAGPTAPARGLCLTQVNY